MLLRENSGLYFLSKGMTASSSPVLDETRLSFFKAFDISPYQQVLIEQHYRSLTYCFAAPELVHTFYSVPLLG